MPIAYMRVLPKSSQALFAFAFSVQVVYHLYLIITLPRNTLLENEEYVRRIAPPLDKNDPRMLPDLHPAMRAPVPSYTYNFSYDVFKNRDSKLSRPTICDEASIPTPLLNGTEVESTISSEKLNDIFQSLVQEYLAPWVPLRGSEKDEEISRPITKKLLNSMELILRGGAFRVRLAGDGTVRYRVLEHWTQTYRVARMTWTLGLLQEAMTRWPELAKLRAEFFVNVGDSPRSTIDSVSRDMGAIPVFSFRSSPAYLDIPVPDPVEFGSNGHYVWKSDDAPLTLEREPRLVFRGSSSSLNEYHDDNWLIVPRLRLAALSRRYPDLIDAGVTTWMKLGQNLSQREVEHSLGARAVPELNFEEQSKYRYVLDVDGGLGSSRKRGILASGSVPFFQKSNWRMWYEPLLKEDVHFVGVDTYLHELVDKVMHARENPSESVAMVKRAQCFAKLAVSYDAALLFWKVLLEGYSQLQRDPVGDDEEVYPNLCQLRPAAAESPMGCTAGWYIYNGSIPFGCRYIGAPNQPFRYECWRNVGYGEEFKFTNDPVHSVYAYDYTA